MTPLLDTRVLSRHFGALQAVNDVSISVQPGEFRAIIGPNGAGKTTLFNLISGKTPPTAGRIFLRGEDVTSMQRLGALPAWHIPHLSNHQHIS